MPLIIGLVSGHAYLCEGEAVPPRPWKAGRFIETRNMQSGHAMIINLAAVAHVEVWPQAQFDAEQKARAEAEAAAKEAEQRRNPNPGREPRILIPRKPS